MPNEIWTRCPHCEAGLRLKDRSAVGKKKRCPNCGEPFTVKPARPQKRKSSSRKTADPETDEFDDDFDQPARSPALRPGSARRSAAKPGRKKPKTRPAPLIWLMVGGGAIVLLLVVGVSILRQRDRGTEQFADSADSKATSTAVSADTGAKASTSTTQPTATEASAASPAADKSPAKAETVDGDASAKVATENTPGPNTDSAADGSNPDGKQAGQGDAVAKHDQDAGTPAENEPAAPAADAGEAGTADSSETSAAHEPDPRGRRGSGKTSVPPPEPIPPSAPAKDLPLITEAPRTIKVDGMFDDWAGVTSYTDPEKDTHDVDHHEYDKPPELADHADTDLLEYKVAHDAENLYLYFRARGLIGRTQRASRGKDKGRYYVIVTMDVDQNDETGYWLHEGGYWPTSRGYDVNAEVEYFGGEFNTGHYLNHGCRNEEEKDRAFFEQSSGKYRPKKAGPYKPGFMQIAPGTYSNYTQWVYQSDDTITFVLDKGPVVRGIVRAALSKDLHEIEVIVPYKGFLKDKAGKPIVALGQVLDLSFSLECSSELVKDKIWISDTGEPIEGYVLTGSADDSVKAPRVGSSQ